MNYRRKIFLVYKTQKEEYLTEKRHTKEVIKWILFRAAMNWNKRSEEIGSLTLMRRVWRTVNSLKLSRRQAWKQSSF